jgi:hypothetical protein
MTANLKNTITNVIAIALVVLGAAQVYLANVNGEELDWVKFAMAIGGALIAYFTGKKTDKPFKA